MLECNFLRENEEEQQTVAAAYGHNKSISILKWEKQEERGERERELQKSFCINRDHERTKRKLLKMYGNSNCWRRP